MKAIAIVLALLTFPLLAQEQPPKDLAKVEEMLKAKPDEPSLHATKCELLFAAGKEQEAYEHATVAMSKFKSKKVRQADIKLGEIKSKTRTIDVYYNMGPKERADKPDGIVRPLSFRVRTSEGKPSKDFVLDFELAYFMGELGTAAIGQMIGNAHGNFGILDPKSDFATIKKKVIEVVDAKE